MSDFYDAFGEDAARAIREERRAYDEKMIEQYGSVPMFHPNARGPIKPGDSELLVYGECPCHPQNPWRAAMPEGSMWPRCPNCGERVKPPSPDPEHPGDHGDRLAYVGKLMPEGDAVAALRRRLPLLERLFPALHRRRRWKRLKKTIENEIRQRREADEKAAERA